MVLLAEWSRIAMQLQTFIASALLLSGLASAVNLPRANEAAECVKPGASCNVLMHRLCCADSVCVTLRARRGEDGVSVTIHVVFFLLLTQLWHIVLRWTLSHLILLIAPVRKLSSTKQGQIKFATIITRSYFISRSWLSFAFA